MVAMCGTTHRQGVWWRAGVTVMIMVLAAGPAFPEKGPWNPKEVRKFAEARTSDPVIQELWIRLSMKHWEFFEDAVHPTLQLRERERWRAFQKEPKDRKEEEYVAAKARGALNATPVDWETVWIALHVAELGFLDDDLVRVSEEVVERTIALKAETVPPKMLSATCAALEVLARTQDAKQIARLVQATTLEYWGLPGDAVYQSRSEPWGRLGLHIAAINALFDAVSLDLAEAAYAQLVEMHPQDEEIPPGSFKQLLVDRIHGNNKSLAEMRDVYDEWAAEREAKKQEEKPSIPMRPALPLYTETSLSNFIEIPHFAKEELTPEQWELLHGAMGMQGDGEELKPLQACEAILGDKTAAPKLFRYAFLRRVVLYSVISREDLAIEVGEDWLATYPDDPLNLRVRVALAGIVVMRGSRNFKPTADDLERICSPIYTTYSPYEGGVIQAHFLHAEGLRRFYSRTKDISLLDSAEAHILEVLRAVELCAEGPTPGTDRPTPKVDVSRLEERARHLLSKITERRDRAVTTAARAQQ